jgi:hypothetical protein
MGSPANTCTAAQTITTPRLTIGGTSGGWVCATQPGDIVDVRGGTYVENLSDTLQGLINGTIDQRKTLRGHVGETVWIQPSGGCSVLSFAAAQALQFWTFSRVNFNGRNLTCGASTAYGVNMGFNSRGMTFQDLEIRDVSNNAGTASTASIGLASGSPNTTLTRVTVSGTHKNFGDFAGSHCLAVAQGTGSLGGDNVTVESGSFHDCGNFGISVNSSSTLYSGGGQSCGVIRWNRIFNNGRNTTSTSGGIALSNNITDTRVYGNLIYNQLRGDGIDVFGTNPRANLVYNNTVVGNPGCLNIGGNATSVGSIAKNNLCKNNTAGLTITSGSTGAIVQNNLLHNSGTQSNTGTGSTIGAPITGDPLLSNVSTQNYHLMPGSAAIDAGQNLTATVPTDFDQVAYNVPMEIGAFAFPLVGTPLHLAFLTQPTTVPEDSLFSVALQVLDDSNTPVTTFTNTLTLAKASGAGALTGTLTCTPSGGQCILNTLVLDTPDTYTLSASATGATGVTSIPFVVTNATTPPPMTRPVNRLRIRQ